MKHPASSIVSRMPGRLRLFKRRMAGNVRYFAVLTRMNMRSSYASPWMFFAFAFAMAAQNFIYFVLWWIYFQNFSSMRGWSFEDLAILMSIVALGFGLAMFFMDGCRTMSRTILTGQLDIYLARPKPVLPAVLMRRSNPASLGDIIGGFAFFFFVADRGMADLPVFLYLGFMAALIVVATAVLLNSLAFWAAGTDRFSSQMLEFFIILSTLPQHGFNWGVKLILFTAVPAGFVGLLPVIIMRDPSLWQLGAMALAAAIYLSIAVLVFRMGLRRYNSGNLWVTLR